MYYFSLRKVHQRTMLKFKMHQNMDAVDTTLVLWHGIVCVVSVSKTQFQHIKLFQVPVIAFLASFRQVDKVSCHFVVTSQGDCAFVGHSAVNWIANGFFAVGIWKYKLPRSHSLFGWSSLPPRNKHPSWATFVTFFFENRTVVYRRDRGEDFFHAAVFIRWIWASLIVVRGASGEGGEALPLSSSDEDESNWLWCEGCLEEGKSSG